MLLLLKGWLPHIFLVGAVVAEVIATSLLKDTNEFKRWDIVLIMMGFYSLSFFMLSIVVKTIPVGVVYAIWSGLGVILISLIAAYKYAEIPNFPTISGLALIVIGVVIVNLYGASH